MQPRRALSQVPPGVPVLATGGGEPQAFLNGAAIAEPIAGGAEIVVVGGKAVESSDGLGERPPWLALFGEGEKIGRVAAAHLVQLTGRVKSFQPELTHGLQHREARLPVHCLHPLQEALVDQGGDSVEGIDAKLTARVGDRLRRLEGASADEDGQAPKEPLLRRGEQIVTPGDGVAHRLLAGRKISPAAGQNDQAALQTRQQRGRRKHFDPGRGELDGERQSIETTTDRRDRGGILSREGKRFLHRLRARDEELDRGGFRHRFVGDLFGRVREPERRHHVLVFPGEAKSSPARDEDPDVGGSAEQIGHERGGVEDVFEIVQNEQQAPLAHECLKTSDQGFMARIAHAEDLSDGGRDQIGMRDRCEADEADAIREILGKPVGDGKGESGLAHATRSGQG